MSVACDRVQWKAQIIGFRTHKSKMFQGERMNTRRPWTIRFKNNSTVNTMMKTTSTMSNA
jgi:hypothetical protein